MLKSFYGYNSGMSVTLTAIKKVDKNSMSGSGIPLRISSVMALRSGINIKSIPDEVLQSVNSIKVHVTSDEWKSVGSTRNFSWRSGGGGGGGINTWHQSNRNSQHHQPSQQQQQQQYQQHSQVQQKYVSKFKKTENLDNTILNTIINGKLNTFSPTNYNDIKCFLEQILDSGETDFLKDFMLLVFKKAAAEEIYCPHYARLLSELSKSYPILNDEMLKLQQTFMGIFDEVEEMSVAKEDYAAFLERNKQKIFRLGYSQFLAELSRNGVLSSTIILATLNKLLDQICIFGQKSDNNKLIEEYCDCLLRMIKIFEKVQSGSYLGSLKTDIHLNMNDRISEILKNSSANYPSISKKAKFSLMDISDILSA